VTAPITSNEPTTTRLHHYAGHYSNVMVHGARTAGHRSKLASAPAGTGEETTIWIAYDILDRLISYPELILLSRTAFPIQNASPHFLSVGKTLTRQQKTPGFQRKPRGGGGGGGGSKPPPIDGPSNSRPRILLRAQSTVIFLGPQHCVDSPLDRLS